MGPLPSVWFISRERHGPGCGGDVSGLLLDVLCGGGAMFTGHIVRWTRWILVVHDRTVLGAIEITRKKRDKPPEVGVIFKNLTWFFNILHGFMYVIMWLAGNSPFRPLLMGLTMAHRRNKVFHTFDSYFFAYTRSPSAVYIGTKFYRWYSVNANVQTLVECRKSLPFSCDFFTGTMWYHPFKNVWEHSAVQLFNSSTT